MLMKKNVNFARMQSEEKVQQQSTNAGELDGLFKSNGVIPDIILQDLKRKGLEVNALTMDDDTSTYTRVKRCPFPSLRKIKCFFYAVSQNQGDTDGIKRNFTVIVPHSFVEHGGCDQKWCHAGDANYRHLSLPGGKILTD
ncbi:hypothetical protein MAR_021670 [Mya arenaria]|uniref:Uncharacterized protein n=1 Tax=Mya arenaria TaxID=6604 RepID=A0ABY7EC96_MYAAR|nr:hypothetical protein MAR_021670 [Mya arenaria]